MSKSLLTAAVTLSLILTPLSAQAVPCVGVCSVSDGNSTIEVEPEETPNAGGMTVWEVDGVNQLFEQGFWVNPGLGGADIHQSGLTLIAADANDVTNVITLDYEDPDGLFSVSAAYELFGGAAGSGLSDIGESFVLENISTGQNPVDLDLTFFVYTDADINVDVDDDSAVFLGTAGDLVGGDTVIQTDSDGVTSVVVSSSTPVNHFQIVEYDALVESATANSLEDDALTLLTDTTSPLGPADITHAFQYEFFTLDAGTSATIEIQKQLTRTVALTEPGTVLLLGLAVLAIACRQRRRR